MKIKKLHTNNLRNNAHFQLMTEFRGTVSIANPVTLKVKSQFDAFLPLYGDEDTALKKITKSAFTEQIRAADAARDDTFSGMVKICEGTCKHFIPYAADAARQVKIILDTYGNAAALTFNEETSAIYNLLQDLRSEKYAVAVAAVGLTPWVDELERRNNTFEVLVGQRYDETAVRPAVAMRDARRAVDAAYSAIIERVEALSVVEGEEVYAAFINRMNAVIDKYAALLAHQRKKGGSAEDDEEEEAQEGGDADI